MYMYGPKPLDLLVQDTPIGPSRSTLSTYYHGDGDYEFYAGRTWRRVTSGVNWVGNPDMLWVSLGSTTDREKLFFDEQNTPALTQLKLRALELCKGKSVGDILKTTIDLVNSLTEIKGQDFRITETNMDNALIKWLKDNLRSHQALCVDLNLFIEKRMLVCRHKALITAAILRTLVENRILPTGIVRQYRSTIVRSAELTSHTWTVFRDSTSGHLWICDPRWRIVGNVNLALNSLGEIYTPVVLQIMMQRLDALDMQPHFAENKDALIGNLQFLFEQQTDFAQIPKETISKKQKLVLFGAVKMNGHNISKGQDICFLHSEFEEFTILENQKEDFVTRNGTFSRFSYKKVKS